jgi:hypothetical protein
MKNASGKPLTLREKKAAQAELAKKQKDALKMAKI